MDGNGSSSAGMNVEEPVDAISENISYWTGVRAGVTKTAPLLLAVPPFAVAMAVAAHGAGFTTLEIVSMSAIVFAGAAQMAAISLYASGATLMAIAITTLLVNLRHIIYGLSLDRALPTRTHPSRAIMAFLLIDESYGLTVANARSGPRPDAFYIGSSLAFYVMFVLSTTIGAVFASAVPEIDQFGLEFIFPLAFISLLLPLIVGAKQLTIALVSGLLALALFQVLDTGIAILLAITGGAMAGALWKEHS